jgi:hypothetical protein
MRRIRNQLGVAMVTVLFAGAVLTVVASAAVYITIKEFRSGQDDRRATEALAYAESGIDRLLLELKGTNGAGWGRLNEAGCKYEPIGLPVGNLGAQKTYNVNLTVYEPSQPLPDLQTWKKPGDTWSSGWNDTSALCTSRDAVSPLDPKMFAITSTGQQPTATKVVRQVVEIAARGLPVGLYADNVNVQGGVPGLFNISLVTSGNVNNRENLTFSGNDPYYKLGHFWDGLSMTTPAPTGVHARGTISCKKQICGNDQVEHPEVLECAANGADGQSQWDQSGGGGVIAAGTPPCAGQTSGPPPYSSFSDADLARARPSPQLTDEDYVNLKAAAQARGLYCNMETGACTTPTQSFTTNKTIQDADIAGVASSFVAYFEFPASSDPFAADSEIKFKAAVGPCSDDPGVHRTVTIVVRYGSLSLEGAGEMVGFFHVPEGEIRLRGSGAGAKIHGTAIAKKLDLGGNGQILNSDCWVRNMPIAMLGVSPLSWSEVDR